jgi:hypothetical protein
MAYPAEPRSSLAERTTAEDAHQVRTRLQSQLAEVAVEASLEGDREAINDVVRYLADDLPELVNVFSLALEMARNHHDT